MRPPVRPPQLRCVFFSSMYLPHLLVLPATFWTSVPFATLSVFPSLICGSCPSGQRFAYSFFQIPSHGGHPCCSAMCFVVAYAHLGLSPIRKRPCWANKTSGSVVFSTAARRFFLFCAAGLFACGGLYKGHFSVRSACVAESFIAFQFVAARSANHQLPMHFFFIQAILL